MPLKFTAFGVHKGNAFLLQRTEHGPRRAWVLVDGGEHPNELSTYLAATFWQNQTLPTRTLPLKDWAKIDVVVLSHTDSDHIGGLIQVFDLPLTVDELWLPDRWAKWIIGLVTTPLGTLFDVEDKVKGTSREEYHQAVKEALAKLRAQDTWGTVDATELRPAQEMQITDAAAHHDMWLRLGTEVLDVLAQNWTKEAGTNTVQTEITSVPDSFRRELKSVVQYARTERVSRCSELIDAVLHVPLPPVPQESGGTARPARAGVDRSQRCSPRGTG